ncbi:MULTISPECIES: hypothetical protein [unclassified Leifsonia]|uniref:hypothetical protein n=1 Tax=unclassified Leifsonia TaxID=2663824 RepID=UPI0008A79050|nr:MULTISPECIES: hypothetical protein [unclassified Leifsonia]SEI17384.1 hypothetical protein SAMN04515694_12835 [Leifsonia sp. CL154]SFM09685.1 hypothetical protein SAMN04515692_1282 [Leifsonia sp. CL147]
MRQLRLRGIAPLWPLVIKPPRSALDNNLLKRIWLPSGRIALPILGDTGSAQEWLLPVLLTIYVGYCAVGEAQALVDAITWPR